MSVEFKTTAVPFKPITVKLIGGKLATDISTCARPKLNIKRNAIRQHPTPKKPT
jgi:hypothetical protein